MTIECDHPRPKLELPGYTPPRLAWQPPAFIPGLDPNASRVIREALQGIYDELMRQGARRNTVPLMEDLALSPGQIVQGVANGEVLTLLPAGLGQGADPVTVILTDVVLPVTVVDPDGTSHSLTSPGVYEFLPDGNESYLGSVFADLLSSFPTDTLAGRDTAGTGALEYISVTAPIEFTGALAIRIGANGITNALLATMAANTFKANVTSGVAAPTDHPFATFAGAGLAYAAGVLDVTGSTSITITSDQVQRAALTGFAEAAANSNATTSAEPIVTFTASANMTAERVLTNGTNTAVDVATPAQIKINVDDFPLTGLADQAAETFNGNFTAGSAPPTARAGSSVAGGGLTYTAGGTLAVGAGTGLTVNANDVAVTIPLTDGDKGDIVVSSSGSVWSIDTGVIVNADVNASAAIALSKLATQNDNTFVGNISGATAVPTAANLSSLAGDGLGYDSTLKQFGLNTSTSIVLASDQPQRAALTGDVTAAQNSNTTAIAAGVIVNADVNASAAIDMTKTGALTGDVTKASGSATTAIAAGVIVNADVNASAAIATSKLADGADFARLSASQTFAADNAFSGELNADGPVRLRGVLNTSATGSLNNLALGGVGVVRLQGPPALFTGMVPDGSGQIVLIVNMTGTSAPISTEDTSSTAANRFAQVDGFTSPAIGAGAMGMAYYDPSSSRWRLLHLGGVTAATT